MLLARAISKINGPLFSIDVSKQNKPTLHRAPVLLPFAYFAVAVFLLIPSAWYKNMFEDSYCRLCVNLHHNPVSSVSLEDHISLSPVGQLSATDPMLCFSNHLCTVLETIILTY